MNHPCQWNHSQSSSRFSHKRHTPQTNHEMRNYLSDFRRQCVHQFGNFNNHVQSVYNRYQKKNQIKNFVMTGKNQKSNSNVLPVVNHVSSFRNIRKPKTK